jgi:hypothetical protein
MVPRPAYLPGSRAPCVARRSFRSTPRPHAGARPASPMRAQPAPAAVLAVNAPTGAGEHAFGGGRGRAGGEAAEHPRVGASPDGQMLPRKAPLGEAADVAGGMHTVQARLGDQTKTATVTCNPGQTVTAKIEIEISGTPVVVVPMPGEGGTAPVVAPVQEKPFHYETPTAKVVTVIVLGVGAVGLLAGGIGSEAAASSQSSTASTDRSALQMGGTSTSVCANNTSTQCANLASANNSSASDHNVAAGLFVGAALLAAAAGVTFAAWPKAKVYDANVVVTPTVGGLSMGGTF